MNEKQSYYTVAMNSPAMIEDFGHFMETAAAQPAASQNGGDEKKDGAARKRKADDWVLLEHYEGPTTPSRTQIDQSSILSKVKRYLLCKAPENPVRPATVYVLFIGQVARLAGLAFASQQYDVLRHRRQADIKMDGSAHVYVADAEHERLFRMLQVHRPEVSRSSKKRHLSTALWFEKFAKDLLSGDRQKRNEADDDEDGVDQASESEEDEGEPQRLVLKVPRVATTRPAAVSAQGSAQNIWLPSAGANSTPARPTTEGGGATPTFTGTTQLDRLAMIAQAPPFSADQAPTRLALVFAPLTSTLPLPSTSASSAVARPGPCGSGTPVQAPNAGLTATRPVPSRSMTYAPSTNPAQPGNTEAKTAQWVAKSILYLYVHSTNGCVKCTEAILSILDGDPAPNDEKAASICEQFRLRNVDFRSQLRRCSQCRTYVCHEHWCRRYEVTSAGANIVKYTCPGCGSVYP